MKTTILRSVFASVLFLMCSLSFAQNIKIIGTIPKTDTGKTYQLQIGAFRLAVNVKQAVEILTKNGFAPQCEKRANLIHVFIVAKANEVQFTVDRLGRAGFKEVIIREYTIKPEADKTPYVEEEVLRVDIKEAEQPYYFDEPLNIEKNFPKEVSTAETEVPAAETELPDQVLLHMYGGM